MSYTKEFIVPAIPIIFELIVRWALLGANNWTYYVNPGTIFISLGLWSALTSTRVPHSSRINTDEEYTSAIERIKSLLIIFSASGFMCFGALSLGDVFEKRFLTLSPPFFDQMRFFFVLFSIVYAVTTYTYVAFNRNKIESLYHD